MRALFVLPIALLGCKPVDSTNRVTGEFSANHPELGTWTVRPTSCEDGREYGFQGILFRFTLPPGPPVTPEAPVPAAPSRTPATGPEEIRLDLARTGDNVIELRYPDRDGTVRRVRERECASITGALERTETGEGQPAKVNGKGSIDCPAFGLRGTFEVAVCRPERR
jgi:hypothetical protein